MTPILLSAAGPSASQPRPWMGFDLGHEVGFFCTVLASDPRAPLASLHDEPSMAMALAALAYASAGLHPTRAGRVVWMPRRDPSVPPHARQSVDGLAVRCRAPDGERAPRSWREFEAWLRERAVELERLAIAGASARGKEPEPPERASRRL